MSHGSATVPSRPHGAPALGGIAPGTLVMTAQGARPIEALAPGDRIVTRDAGMMRLLDLRVRHLAGVRPCRIRPSALAHDRPGSDVILAPTQRVLVRGWRARALYGTRFAQVPVSRLVDGTYIARLAPRTLRVIEPVFEQAHIIYAGGIELAAATPLTATA